MDRTKPAGSSNPISAEMRENWRAIMDDGTVVCAGAKFVTLQNIPASAGSIPAANMQGINARKLNAGTIRTARFGTLNARQIMAGTVYAARFGSIDALQLKKGTIQYARLFGSPEATKFLRGDRTFKDVIPTQVNDVETAGVAYITSETTILSVAKTITSGNTVLLLASGYIKMTSTWEQDWGYTTIKLKQGSTVVQTVILQVEDQAATNNTVPFSFCGIVTGLSSEITFSVTAFSSGEIYHGTAYGNLIVLEF